MKYIVTREELKDWKSRPFEVKLEMSKERIRSWYEAWDGMISVSFSGGLDSTMLLHLVRSLYPEVPGVFVDTGTEYPEMIKFIKTQENIIRLRGKLSFRQVIEQHGYPAISKDVSRRIHDCQNPTLKNEATINLRLTGEKRDGKVSKNEMLPVKIPVFNKLRD